MRVGCWAVGAGGVGRDGFWLVRGYSLHDVFLLSVATSRFDECVEGLADKSAIG